MRLRWMPSAGSAPQRSSIGPAEADISHRVPRPIRSALSSRCQVTFKKSNWSCAARKMWCDAVSCRPWRGRCNFFVLLLCAGVASECNSFGGWNPMAHSSRPSVVRGSSSPSQPNSSSDPTSPSSDWLLAISFRLRFSEAAGKIGDVLVAMSSWLMLVSRRPCWWC